MSIPTAFLDQPPAGTIDLGIGQPSADSLPLDLIREATESFLTEAHPFDLTYGATQGDQRFLESLAGYLSEAYDTPVPPESLCLTAGNSQALDLISTMFTKHGETVFVEEPSYYLAHQIFRDHGLNIVGIPIDENGLNIDALEAALAEQVPAFVYVIPSYHNPGGHCMSTERRTRLIELSQRHGFLIVADEVYHLLHYGDPPPPAFGTMIESDTVLSLGSFAKIFLPAMRLGWIQTGPGLLRRVLENGYINSGGSINHYASHVVRCAIDLGLQQAHLAKLRRTYRGRVEAMQAALDTHFRDLATWQRPQGGFFFWLRFDDHIDTGRLLDRAASLETGFTPGSAFSHDGGLKNCMRLCFTHYGEDDIREGIARLRTVFEQ